MPCFISKYFLIIIYSNLYNNISGANYNPDWQQSGFTTANPLFAPVIASNVVLAYPNFSYQGIEFNSVLNITTMDFLHLDIWTVDGVLPSLSVISSGTEIPHPIPNGDGIWQSIDIPVTGITGNLASAIQLKFTGGNGSSTRIYTDNIYLWKGQPVGIEELDVEEFNVYPNPTTNVWTLTNSSTMEMIEVLDFQGKLVKSLEINAKKTTIDATELQNGIYFVRVNLPTGIKTLKLIKN